ncbi:MAG TPA: ComEC/Rec2 family competence protein, partial [Verrucomicrobiae bacterium]|nr:ComEC/Rec2 family competence protein [Verrucomicrobiae bacterium]
QITFMKSAYELAMERLNKTSPTVKLSAAQKAELAELDSKYAAKVAEREIALKDEMNKATEAGDADKLEQIRQQLSDDKRKLQSELEDKKDRIRQGK